MPDPEVSKKHADIWTCARASSIARLGSFTNSVWVEDRSIQWPFWVRRRSTRLVDGELVDASKVVKARSSALAGFTC